MPSADAPTYAGPPDRAKPQDQVALATQAFALGALRIALAMGALVSILLLGALVIGGSATRWVVTGTALVALWTLAAWRPEMPARLLARRHATSALAAALGLAIALEGTWHNPSWESGSR